MNNNIQIIAKISETTDLRDGRLRLDHHRTRAPGMSTRDENENILGYLKGLCLNCTTHLYFSVPGGGQNSRKVIISSDERINSISQLHNFST